MSNAAVALVRVSTDEQAASGLGLEGQRAAIEAFSARSGFDVEHWAVEAGVSGGAQLADRPVLLDALGRVAELGAGAALIVSCFDRLARSVLTAELVRLELKRTGAVLRSADGQANDDSPEGRLVSTILVAVSEFERAKIALRTRAALRAKRARGEALGGSKPFGRDAGELAALTRLAELKASGASPAYIAAQLTREGHVGRRGAPITHNWVQRRLAQRPK